MASNQSTIDIVLNAIDNTSTGINQALGNVESLAGQVSKVAEPMADITDAAFKFEAALLASGAAMTTFAVVKAAEFESALVGLQKVLGDNENIDEFADAAFRVSETFGQSSVTVLESVTNFKQAGYTAQEATELLDASFKGVIAGGLSAQEATDGLIASLKGFGGEAGDAATYIDLFNKVSDNFGANASQLLEGFSQLSPVANAAGLSLEETIGMLTPVIEVFQSGSEAATGLKAALLNLISDNKNVTDALTALGVAQKDANGELRSARDIYFDVAEAFQGLTDEQQLFYAGQIAGKNQVAKFTAALNGLATTNVITAESFEFLGSAQKEVDAQLDTLTVKYAQLGAAIDNSLIKIGGPLVDSYKGVVDALTEVFKAVGASAQESEGLAQVFEYLNGVVGSFEDTLRQIAKNLPAALNQADFSGFTNGVQEIIDAFGVLSEGSDITSVDGLVGVIETLGGAFEGLSTFVGSAIEAWDPLLDVLKNGVEGGGLSQDLKEVFETLGTIGGAAQQVTILTGAIEGVVPSLQSLINLFVAGQLVQGITGLKDGIGALIPKLVGQAGLAYAAFQAGTAVGGLINVLTETATGKSASDWLADAFWAMDQFFGITDTTTVAVQENQQAQENLATSAANLASAADDAADGIDKTNQALEGNTKQVYNFSTGLVETVPVVEELAQEIDGFAVGPMAVLNQAIDLENRKLEEANNAWGSNVVAIDSAAKSTSKVTQELNKLDEAAAKIAVQERIALIEAQANITATAIEADATKIAAAFEAIGESVTSTGDTLSSLYELLGDANISKFDKLDIKSQIEEEAEARAKLLELQVQQTELTIRETEARLASLENGGALITVNGDGLEPHLEAFMWEILSAIQVRASNEGYDLILGAINQNKAA